MLRSIALFALGMLLAACGQRAVPGARLRIAVVPKGTSHVFWRAVHCGVAQAERDFGDVEVVWKAPTGESDVAQQIALVESFVADRYDGICIAPLDSRALEEPIRAALARGVPVVVFDSPLERCDLGVVSTVATDNRRGGTLAGAELARRLDGQGDVVVLRYMVGSCSTIAREEGCLEELARHPGIRVVSSELHAGPDEASAVAAAERLLATYGDRLRGVFCPNESTLSGFLTAVQRDPRPEVRRIRIVGFDASTRIAEALKQGTLDATVVQDPVRMGHAAVATLRSHLRGESAETVVETKETLITRENVGEPQMQKLLDPLGEHP